MQILLIRHADPDYSIDDLTDAGHLEAAALGKHMNDFHLDTLYASSLGRAQTTAKYISKQKHMPIHTLDWAKELDGWVSKFPNGENGPSWNYPAEHMDIRTRDLLKWTRTEDHWLQNEYESQKYEQLIADSDHFLAGLGFKRYGGTYQITDPSAERKKIAIVCHNGFGLAWLAHLLHIPLSIIWQSFWLPTSSVTTVLFEKRDSNIAVPRCIRLSDVSHLEKAKLPVSQNGLLATNYDSNH